MQTNKDSGGLSSFQKTQQIGPGIHASFVNHIHNFIYIYIYIVHIYIYVSHPCSINAFKLIGESIMDSPFFFQAFFC
jgi:hypothetical protein